MNILLIQADFSYPVLVKKISTRGSPDTKHWVKTYNLVFKYDDQDVDEWYLTEAGQKMVGSNSKFVHTGSFSLNLPTGTPSRYPYYG